MNQRAKVFLCNHSYLLIRKIPRRQARTEVDLNGDCVTRKKAILVLILVLAGTWFAYHLRSQHVQAQRERFYQSVLTEYQRDLHLGMSRADVGNYLNSHHTHYGDASMMGSGNAWSYQVRIGTEPSGMIGCGNWEVYIALDFENTSRKPTGTKGDPPGDPADVLKNIRIYKFCW